MRQGPNPKRSRGRNNNGRRPNMPLRMQTFDSNGPDVRIRGSAFQVHEKYLQLARDAASSGDRIIAESYLQHAEHYYRIIAAAQEQQQQNGGEAGRRYRADGSYADPDYRGQGDDGDFGDDFDDAGEQPSLPPASRPEGGYRQPNDQQYRRQQEGQYRPERDSQHRGAADGAYRQDGEGGHRNGHAAEEPSPMPPRTRQFDERRPVERRPDERRPDERRVDERRADERRVDDRRPDERREPQPQPQPVEAKVWQAPEPVAVAAEPVPAEVAADAPPRPRRGRPRRDRSLTAQPSLIPEPAPEG